MCNSHTTILKHSLGKDGAAKALVSAVEAYSKQYEEAGVKWTCPEPGVVEVSFMFKDAVVETRGQASDDELAFGS